MMEWITNAWAGWQNYKDGVKLIALLILALLLFWFLWEKERKHYRRVVLYTTLMTVCCICPLTAALLMGYQTKFYDYEWIWNAVPITIVIALAGTILWTGLTERYRGQKGYQWKCIGITGLLVAVILLCGSLGNPDLGQKELIYEWEVNDEPMHGEKLAETERVLAVLAESGEITENETATETGATAESQTATANETIVLWAPKNIMEYARALDGDIRLVYGRNMWDISLNAYSYDTYGDGENTLYAWMNNLEETGVAEVTVKLSSGSKQTVDAVTCIELAEQLGVTHILLPGNLQQEYIEEIEETMNFSVEPVEGYYFLRIG